MNQYQHAIETRRIALNDQGLVAWVKHNETAIMEALKWAGQIDELRQKGHTAFTMQDEPTAPATAYSPALDFDAGEGK
ncbi:hypothetical protein [Spirosoma sp. KUDC1026]|uniref:hypothetical protein n=1 Tax=Spirosoma sp. KUDC1026 TaxID=2745947 RepID=UPI00159BE898|nr:hypothetical protein [Spirosoma sp. KUDC1026]QKZ15894.1 hypothetical protein HU175_24560 [Spirosoma sp. KUDC1026]